MAKLLEKARVGGIIDCDGSFGLYLIKRTRKWQTKNGIKERKALRLMLTIQLANKYKVIPKELHKLYGGNLFSYFRTTNLTGEEPVKYWKWHIQTNKRVIEVLEEIEPFLVLKRGKARRIIENKELILAPRRTFKDRLPQIRKLVKELRVATKQRH